MHENPSENVVRTTLTFFTHSCWSINYNKNSRFLVEVKVKVAQSCLTLCDSMDYTVYGILQATILEWVAIPFSRGSSQPRCPILQVDSLPAEPQERPKNTGVGSLSLLQVIFPTQGSNPDLPYCRRILYQLSHKGSPRILEGVAYPFSSRSSWPRNQPGVPF